MNLFPRFKNRKMYRLDQNLTFYFFNNPKINLSLFYCLYFIFAKIVFIHDLQNLFIKAQRSKRMQFCIENVQTKFSI